MAPCYSPGRVLLAPSAFRSSCLCYDQRHRTPSKRRIESVKRVIVLLLFLGAALHFYRLDEPREVVFDEVHFGGFVNSYCGSGSYFFDIHPPHAKLMIAGAAWLGGYRGDQPFASIGEPITALSPALLRLVPAVSGSLLPALILVVLLQLGASRPAAFLGGFAVLLDNGLLIQTRIAALDGPLLLATFGAISAALAARAAGAGDSRRGWWLLAGALAGLAAGIKFTGLIALGIVALCAAAPFACSPRWERFRIMVSGAVWVLAGATAVYLAGWFIHFHLLTEAGPGNAWGPLTGDLLRDTVRVHQRMLSANLTLESLHPYASPWWSWPAMARPIFYWNDAENILYFVGNPVVWWLSSLGVIAFASISLLMRASSLTVNQSAGAALKGRNDIWIPVVGFVLSLAPLTFVPRILFLYHYLTPLLFAICVVVLGLDQIGWSRPGGLRDQRRSYHVVLLLIAAGFAATAPFSFSFVHASGYQELVFSIFPAWR